MCGRVHQCKDQLGEMFISLGHETDVSGGGCGCCLTFCCNLEIVFLLLRELSLYVFVTSLLSSHHHHSLVLPIYQSYRSVENSAGW